MHERITPKCKRFEKHANISQTEYSTLSILFQTIK